MEPSGVVPTCHPWSLNDIQPAIRGWTANHYYVEDTTEGTVPGQPVFFAKAGLGYSNIDQRYEWVTIAPLDSDDDLCRQTRIR